MNALFAQHGAAIHTAFPAKVLSCSGNTAKVQPLFNFNGAPATPLDGGRHHDALDEASAAPGRRYRLLRGGGADPGRHLER